MFMSNDCENTGKMYCVSFLRNVQKNFMGRSFNIVNNTNGEGFAWGLVRMALEAEHKPLKGLVRNVVLTDAQTHEVIWSCDVLDVESSIEKLQK